MDRLQMSYIFSEPRADLGDVTSSQCRGETLRILVSLKQETGSALHCLMFENIKCTCLYVSESFFGIIVIQYFMFFADLWTFKNPLLNINNPLNWISAKIKKH